MRSEEFGIIDMYTINCELCDADCELCISYCDSCDADCELCIVSCAL